jgi:hypothetical protein
VHFSYMTVKVAVVCFGLLLAPESIVGWRSVLAYEMSPDDLRHFERRTLMPNIQTKTGDIHENRWLQLQDSSQMCLL